METQQQADVCQALFSGSMGQLSSLCCITSDLSIKGLRLVAT